MADDFWSSLKRVLRDPGMGAATKLCFAHLWRLAGCRPGHIVISLYDLGASLGRSGRAASKWIGELVSADLVEVREHDKRRGRMQIFLFSPNPGHAERAPDPQRRLPLDPAGSPEDAQTSDVTAPKRPTDAGTSDVSAHKRPRPGAQNRAACPVAPERSDVTARKRPSDAGTSDVTARKRPSDAGTSDVSAPKRPRPRWEQAGKPHAPPRARSTSTSTDDDDVDKWSTSTSTSTDDQKCADTKTADEPRTEPELWLAAVDAAFHWIERYPMLRPRSRDPRNRSLFLKACYLAETAFGEGWLVDALEAVAHMRPRQGERPNPWAYLYTCLADRAGMSPEEFNRCLAPITLTLADEMITLRTMVSAGTSRKDST